MTRKSKIARLPRPIRDELNHRLDNGQPGIRLVEWLNSLPEVREILACEFQGRRITQQNVSEWRSGGYHDWLAHQEQQATLREFLADAKELGEAASPEKMTEAMFNFVTVHYAAAMYDWTMRPDNRDKLNLWSPILNDVIRLRNSDLAQQRFELDQEKLELRTEVARHRLELDRAHLDLARHKAGLREEDRTAAVPGRSNATNQAGISPSHASTTSPSPIGWERAEVRAGSQGEPSFDVPGLKNPSPKIALSLEKVVSPTSQNLSADTTSPFAPARNTQHATRNTAPPSASTGPIHTSETSKHPLIINHLQPNPTKSNNHFFIFPPTGHHESDPLQAIDNQEESVKCAFRASEIFTKSLCAA